MKLKLHLGLAGILPNRIINFLLALRAAYYRMKLRLFDIGGKQQGKEQHNAKTAEE